MTRKYAAEDNVEPIADSLGEIWGSAATYNVVSGCELSYSSANMTVDLASGVITHNGTRVTIATAAAAFTVVSDPSNPRWTWLALASNGAAVVVSGDPAVAPGIPELGDRVPLALLLVQANQTIVANITYKLDQRVDAVPSSYVYKYKTATQSWSADTSLANVTAASGNFAFDMLANEVWRVRYQIPISFSTGTGGAKFQLSGPSSPTKVSIVSMSQQITASGVIPLMNWAMVTAFATNIAAGNSENGSATGPYYDGGVTVVMIEAFIVNGSTAGTVTLQAAQNSANSTTTIAASAYMVAERLA